MMNTATQNMVRAFMPLSARARRLLGGMFG